MVATAVPGIADVLPADATVPAGDPAALAAAIGARLADPSRLAAESLRATRYARGYDLRVTLSELAALTTGLRTLAVPQFGPAQRTSG